MDPESGIRAVRARLAELRAESEQLERRLAELLRAAGRRAAEGDQQPKLFPTAKQPTLFGG